MSDLGLLSSVHSSFEEYATLLDDVIAELQSDTGQTDKCQRLIALLSEVQNGADGGASLRAIQFSYMLNDAYGRPVDNFADLVAQLQAGRRDVPLLSRVSALSSHLEKERAAIAHRMRR
ncbi:hypothetical protein LAV84_25455 [Rhizobium sp. VS19-DR104.2]|uniref:hypothetical protein n=1 Tax=unclassified Rhizobium TaxID=2613769 RepID=UPI001C5A847E|nr:MULTISPECIES: hypothetical protein [unclassified Rhizobium]MBZ5762899.1 hypothetical protein [Rhizobium sp. VS19-DR96]MBZ5768736.1 hypothetical protein [Rhizobium sp. VS19-DR129.2]MBZ5776309.1 hypothetical protein [Rhizobium sp. VS19-DRK62.2]MBZ5787474.1 hypothetical protein [Rhizobium sp. VS19-DR121]MBZ5804872.1 hypothetical protein [Rhizobium sp. VS19-DR181]